MLKCIDVCCTHQSINCLINIFKAATRLLLQLILLHNIIINCANYANSTICEKGSPLSLIETLRLFCPLVPSRVIWNLLRKFSKRLYVGKTNDRWIGFLSERVIYSSCSNKTEKVKFVKGLQTLVFLTFTNVLRVLQKSNLESYHSLIYGIDCISRAWEE